MAMDQEDLAMVILLEILATLRLGEIHMEIQHTPTHVQVLVEAAARREREMEGRIGVLLKGRTATIQIAV